MGAGGEGVCWGRYHGQYGVREELVSSVNIQESTCLQKQAAPYNEKIKEDLSFAPFRLSGICEAIRVCVRN